jgi:hypothetical protein
MDTYASALRLVGATVPGHLEGEAEIPVLSGPQAQGDLLVLPAEAPGGGWRTVPPEGIQVIHGEATGNTHWLHAGFESSGVSWLDAADSDLREGDADVLTLGYLRVPPGQSALLIHTDEHGANGIGPGRYAINRKRQMTPRFSAGRPAFALVED